MGALEHAPEAAFAGSFAACVACAVAGVDEAVLDIAGLEQRFAAPDVGVDAQAAVQVAAAALVPGQWAERQWLAERPYLASKARLSGLGSSVLFRSYFASQLIVTFAQTIQIQSFA